MLFIRDLWRISGGWGTFLKKIPITIGLLYLFTLGMDPAHAKIIIGSGISVIMLYAALICALLWLSYRIQGRQEQ